MSEDIPGLVETSSNLGIISSNGERVKFCVSLRSSKNEEKAKLLSHVEYVAKQYEAQVSRHGEYPAWEYKNKSKLCELMQKNHFDIYGCEPKIVTIHAGLECGIFAGKIKDLECVSIGPDNYGIHTTEERLSVSSTVRVWEYLKALLKNMKP